jgi:hypothetical protein
VGKKNFGFLGRDFRRSRLGRVLSIYYPVDRVRRRRFASMCHLILLVLSISWAIMIPSCGFSFMDDTRLL